MTLALALAGKVIDGTYEELKKKTLYTLHMHWIIMWDFRISSKYDALLIWATFWIILCRHVEVSGNEHETILEHPAWLRSAWYKASGQIALTSPYVRLKQTHLVLELFYLWVQDFV